VGLLRVLGLGRVLARRARHVAVAVFLADHPARGLHGFRRHVDAVGTHIGDETDGLAADVDAFVEPLRDAHGLRRGKAELARGLLLQGRGGERRVGVALGGLRLDVRYREGRKLQILLEGLGVLAVADVEARDLLAVGAHEARVEHAAVLGGERRDQRPVFARLEGLDLELAVADEAQRHRLDATGRARSRQLAPEHGGQGEADEIVEGAAGEIGVDQGLIDLTRVAQSRLHRILGDGVEGHALDRQVLQDALFPKRLQHVPGNGLALAVRVGGQDELLGALDRLGDIGDPLRAPVLERPDHAEVVIRVDRAVLGGQIADMPEGGQDLVILAEIFVDRLGLRRRLDDEDFHERLPKSGNRRTPCCQGESGGRPGPPQGGNKWLMIGDKSNRTCPRVPYMATTARSNKGFTAAPRSLAPIIRDGAARRVRA
jgi:hypothetical protein